MKVSSLTCDVDNNNNNNNNKKRFIMIAINNAGQGHKHSQAMCQFPCSPSS